jgi:hypothetical protein
METLAVIGVILLIFFGRFLFWTLPGALWSWHKLQRELREDEERERREDD